MNHKRYVRVVDILIQSHATSPPPPYLSSSTLAVLGTFNDTGKIEKLDAGALVVDNAYGVIIVFFFEQVNF